MISTKTKLAIKLDSMAEKGVAKYNWKGFDLAFFHRVCKPRVFCSH